MPFCNRCSSNSAEGAMFCSQCGNRLTETSAESPVEDPIMRDNQEKVVWRGAPERLGIRASQSYTLTNQRLIVQSSFVGDPQGEIELARVTNVKITRTPFEQGLGVGDIAVEAAGASDDILILDNVPDPFTVAETIRSAIKQAHQS